MLQGSCFIFSALPFRCLIHFEFIFRYGVRKCSGFILSCIVDVSQQNLLRRLFLHCLFLAFFVKENVSSSAWIYFWPFCFVPLIYISVFVPVPYCLDDYGFVV